MKDPYKLIAIPGQGKNSKTKKKVFSCIANWTRFGDGYGICSVLVNEVDNASNQT